MVLAPQGIGFQVVEVKIGSCVAASAARRIDERALLAVAHRDRPANLGGDSAGSRTWRPPAAAVTDRTIGVSELAAAEVAQQGIESALKDLGQVPSRNGMAEKLLHGPELVVQLLAGGELDHVSGRAEW